MFVISSWYKLKIVVFCTLFKHFLIYYKGRLLCSVSPFFYDVTSDPANKALFREAAIAVSRRVSILRNPLAYALAFVNRPRIKRLHYQTY